MAEATLGLDLGGAHLKVAVVTGGRVAAARQVPCRLWQGLDRLEPAFAAALEGLPAPQRIALTMTGELVDLFADRASGVRALIEAVRTRLPQPELLVWAGAEGLVTPAVADRCPGA